MISDLRKAIAKRLEKTPALLGGFWYVEAPQKSAYPYAVFSFVTATDERDTASRFETVYLQINVYHKDGAKVETAADLVMSKFDDAESAFNMASYHLERIDRQFRRAMKAEEVFIITIQYKIELTRK